jgi:hypothetical protein
VVIGRHLNAQPPALAGTRPELGALDEVLFVALAKEAKDRFARCSDFARALNEQAITLEPVSPNARTTPALVAERLTPRATPAAAKPRPKVASAGAKAAPNKQRESPESANGATPRTALAGRAQVPTQRKRWLRPRVILPAVLVVLVVGGLAFGRLVIRSNYYVAEYDGAVYIMRGVQGSFLGMPLQQPFRLACLDSRAELTIIGADDPPGGCQALKSDDLRESERAQVKAGLPTGGVDDAIRQLKELGHSSLLPVCLPQETDTNCR